MKFHETNTRSCKRASDRVQASREGLACPDGPPLGAILGSNKNFLAAVPEGSETLNVFVQKTVYCTFCCHVVCHFCHKANIFFFFFFQHTLFVLQVVAGTEKEKARNGSSCCSFPT